ncbi:acyltransferase family protein [Nocardioides pacificus]
MNAPNPRRNAGQHRRADIQGLRAVAVLLVVAHHLTGRPAGGFIGVDVFFVISGFLITGLLLGVGRGGRISLRDFYVRRARRILPAALLVLAVTVLASAVLLLADRAERVAEDALWAAGFAANWHFADVGTDYFASALPDSPLRHYWSLAVEEQFYVVWPLLVVAAVALTRRRTRLTAARLVGVVALVVVAASFAWAVHQAVSDPTVAYFSTLTRGWELGVGALLAVGAGRLGHLTPAARNTLALTGIAGLAVSVVAITEDSLFPAPVGALPVLSAALLLAAGTGAAGADRIGATWLLRQRPATYLGDISYSLYLWHWPVIVLLPAALPSGLDLPADGWAQRSLALAVTLAATVASYHLVERPFLSPRAAGGARRTTRHRLQGGALGAIVAVAASALVVSLVPVSAPPAPSVARGLAVSDPADGPPPLEQLSDGLREALDATRFPALSPALGDVAAGITPEMEPPAGCLNPPLLGTPTDCLYGDESAPRTAVVVGDSVAVSWVPAVRAALEEEGYRIHAVGVSNCPVADVDIVAEVSLDPGHPCGQQHDAVYAQVDALDPDLVIASDTELGILRLSSGATEQQAVREWDRGMRSALRQLSSGGAEVVVLAPNPAGTAPEDCVTPKATPADCEAVITDQWLWKQAAELSATRATGARYVDTRPWFCIEGRCPIFSLGMTVRWDMLHVTGDYMKLLGPWLRAALIGT